MPARHVSRRTSLALLFAGLPAAAVAQNSLFGQGRELLEKVPQGVPGAAGGQASSGGAGANLSQGEIGSGLKDALRIASQRVVGRVGKADGYNGDPAIRIPLPEGKRLEYAVADTERHARRPAAQDEPGG